ncbi:MAG: FAD-binding oxidoreductase [Candidatus Eremiobacteraeota bacterium]|nr:FAD-binding oxidoreductase [Candidatus Eremiobacteraeota bacterium]
MLADAASIEPYVTDWRGTFVGRASAVVRPASTEQVSEVVRICSDARIPIVPQGGNTGLAAGATPLQLRDAIIVSLSRMRRIVSVDADAYAVTVEAGCVLADVQQAARRAERLFPLSLAAEGSAEIGGLVSTNAGGTAVLRYGTMRSLVLGLEAVLPDGRIVDGLRALYKDNAGYDWKQLFIGAEGTLGIVTRAVLRLFPMPRERVTALIGIDLSETALRVFSHLQTMLGETLSACELFPDRALALRVAYEPGLRRPMAEHAWYLLVEATSSLSTLRTAAEEAFVALDDAGLAGAIVIAENSAQARALWEWRETITETEKRTGRSVKHDVSVPISAIPEFIARATERIERDHPGVTVLAFGHFGDGNIHFNVLVPGATTAVVDAISAAVYEMIADFRGSITAEHGIGRYRRNELLAHRSIFEMDLMRTVKRALDPGNVMNPGAVLEE